MDLFYSFITVFDLTEEIKADNFLKQKVSNTKRLLITLFDFETYNEETKFL